MSPKSAAKKSKKTANTKSKKSQDKKSAKAVEEDASELRLLEVAREMETSGTQREGTPPVVSSGNVFARCAGYSLDYCVLHF